MTNFDDRPGICDHCGTFVNAMRRWENWETMGCLCKCHIPLEVLNPEWAATKKKRKGKKP